MPAYLAVSGEAATNATVTLWWGTNEWAPVVRQGRYWYGEAAVNNRTGGVWVVVTNLGVVRGNPDRVQSEVRSDFVAQSPEALAYDGDGNLVRDGRWMYSWDAENRLVRVMSYGATDRASWRRVDWAYDALGRRIRQTSYVLSNRVWVVTEDLKFVSDPVLFGRHMAELNATNNILVRSYVWGLDLSGTEGGAGGVGGLLWVNQHSGPCAGAHFCAYDGNGNIVALIAAADGSETARYEDGPFGEPLRSTGPAAAFNPFQFSTKRTDPATGLALYEYRAYSPALGRWLSRDPLGEAKDIALYTCAVNAPLGLYDVLGLASRPCREAIRKDGRPRIVFDPAPPAGGWKGVVRFSGYSGSAQARMFHEIHIEWKASVAVLCVCAGGCEVRRGQRVYRGMGTGDWLVYDPTSLPEQIPNPYQDLWRRLGELLAALFLEVIGPVPLLADEGELASVGATVTAMVARRPTTLWEGEWSDGKSPCDR